MPESEGWKKVKIDYVGYMPTDDDLLDFWFFAPEKLRHYLSFGWILDARGRTGSAGILLHGVKFYALPFLEARPTEPPAISLVRQSFKLLKERGVDWLRVFEGLLLKSLLWADKTKMKPPLTAGDVLQCCPDDEDYERAKKWLLTFNAFTSLLLIDGEKLKELVQRYCKLHGIDEIGLPELEDALDW
jgi:hypothetical protein